MNPMDVKRGIDAASNHILKWLTDKAKAVETADEIQAVATISANNESSIGALIADAMKKVGKDGVITIEDEIKHKDRYQDPKASCS